MYGVRNSRQKRKGRKMILRQQCAWGDWKNINKAIEDGAEQKKGNNSSGQTERATCVRILC